MQTVELQAKERTEPAIAAGMWIGLWIGEVLVATQFWVSRAAQGAKRPVVALCSFAVGAAVAFTALSATAGSHSVRSATLDMKALMNSIELYQSEVGAVPDRLADLVPKYARGLHADPWGQPYALYRGAGGAAIVSAGPDGKFGTADDLVLLPKK